VILGLDFDNTIASYDDLMHRLAVQWGWLDSGLPSSKRTVRDALRALPDGESKWRRLQTHCYGPGMSDAQPMDGVEDFLAACKERRIPVWIVSHKTQFANFGDPTVNLRAAAVTWMNQQGLLDADRFGLGLERVFFEETRQEKIDRIRSLGITHYVDDLEETFLEKSFPPEVNKILFSPQPLRNGNPHCRAFRTWPDIGQHLFAHDRA